MKIKEKADIQSRKEQQAKVKFKQKSLLLRLLFIIFIIRY